MYLQDKDFDLYHVPGKEEHQCVPDALSRLCENHFPPPPTLAARSIVIEVPQDIYDRLSKIHNSHIGHAGLKVCKKPLLRIHIRRKKRRQEPEAKIPDRMKLRYLIRIYSTMPCLGQLEILGKSIGVDSLEIIQNQHRSKKRFLLIRNPFDASNYQTPKRLIRLWR